MSFMTEKKIAKWAKHVVEIPLGSGKGQRLINSLYICPSCDGCGYKCDEFGEFLDSCEYCYSTGQVPRRLLKKYNRNH